MEDGFDYLTAYIQNSMWVNCQADGIKKVVKAIGNKYGNVDVSNEAFFQWVGDTLLDGEDQTKLAYLHFLASQVFYKVIQHFNIPTLQIKIHPLEDTDCSNYWLVFDANTSLLSDDEYDLLTSLKKFEA